MSAKGHMVKKGLGDREGRAAPLRIWGTAFQAKGTEGVKVRWELI